MAHTPANDLRGDMQRNPERVCAKLHMELTVSCVLKCYSVCIFFVCDHGRT